MSKNWYYIVIKAFHHIMASVTSIGHRCKKMSYLSKNRKSAKKRKCHS